jgi:TRAP-type mannitol/chloroaromatic compound transport system permease small subunit
MSDERSGGGGLAAAFRLFVRIAAIANVVATAWIVGLMFLIVLDVAGRNLFLAPIAGVPEMVAYSIVGIVFLQVTHTHVTNQMIRSEGFVELFANKRPRISNFLLMFGEAVGAVLFILLAAAAWPRLMSAYARGEYVGAAGYFQLTVWPFFLLIMMGSAFLGVSYVFAFLRLCGLPVDGRKAEGRG